MTISGKRASSSARPAVSGLQGRAYWFHTYFSVELSRSVDQHRAFVRDRIGAFAAGHARRGITDIAIWPNPAKGENHRHLRCADAWLRIARACAEEELLFWLPLAGSGSTIHYFPPAVIDAINTDANVAPFFLGLFAFEQPTPSLGRGDHFDLKYFFDDTHVRFPNGVCDFAAEHWALPTEERYRAEFDPQHGGVIEPLDRPIANPTDALEISRRAYHRWADAYLSKLRKGQSLSLLSWTSANRWFDCGFDGVKQAMSLHPFDRLNMMVEVNNDEMSIAYAQARGISRMTGVPWGCMVGGVRWKYWNQYLRDTGRPHAPVADYNAYGKSPNVPPWMFFIPMAVAWAGGARQFSFEADAEQVSASSGIRSAIKSFHDFLDAAGDEPFEPHVGVALLKGNGYFAWDMPGYAENGMADEINAHGRYYNGRNATSPGPSASPITEIFYPRTVNMREWYDAIFSGNPSGEIDILPATATAADLKRYRTVIVFEWNCLDDVTYRKLLAHARGGGTVVIAAGQLLAPSSGVVDWRNPPAAQFHPAAARLTGATFIGGSTVDPHLYKLRLANGKVERRARDRRPVVVHHRVGKGTVLTVCGPSYRAALGDAMPGFFAELARQNQQRLPYDISGLSDEERKDLAVFADTGAGRQRVAMVNYWDRFDMQPRIALRGVAGKRLGQRIVVHDSGGLVADVTLPPRAVPPAGSEITVLSQSLALLTWQRTPADQFSITHVVRDFDLLAHRDITLTYGQARLSFTKHRSPHRPEKERDLSIGIEALRRGRWTIRCRIDGADAVSHLVTVDPDGVLRLPPGALGQVHAGQRIQLDGARK